METLQYKVSFLDGQEKSGNASKIFIKDALTVLNLNGHSGPLISVLKEGSFQLHHPDATMEEFSYKEGFLKVSANRCVITILKYE